MTYNRRKGCGDSGFFIFIAVLAIACFWTGFVCYSNGLKTGFERGVLALDAKQAQVIIDANGEKHVYRIKTTK